MIIGCTASECGLPADHTLTNCSMTKIECASNLQACVNHPARLLEDNCRTNYAAKKEHGFVGRDACNSKHAGGDPSCIYDKRTDACFASDGCDCTKEYVDCVKDHGCPVTDEFDSAIAEQCVADGCSAEECGFPVTQTGFCGRVADSCSASYYQCENVITQIAFSKMEPISKCSGCLKNYYICMASRNCMSLEDSLKHRNMCLNEGCSSEECGFTADLGVVRYFMC